MSRFAFALIAAWILASPARADERPCPAVYDRGMSLLPLSGSHEPVDQIMADLVSLRIVAIDDAAKALSAMPPRPDEKRFFQPWSFETVAARQMKWDMEHLERQARLEAACAALQARIIEFESIKK